MNPSCEAGRGADPLAHAGSEDRLLVIIPDRLSLLVRKGEVTSRYYNPGNLFRHVDILMTNDDRPDPDALLEPRDRRVRVAGRERPP